MCIRNMLPTHWKWGICHFQMYADYTESPRFLGDGCTCANSDTRLFDEQPGYEAIVAISLFFLWNMFTVTRCMFAHTVQLCFFFCFFSSVIFHLLLHVFLAPVCDIRFGSLYSGGLLPVRPLLFGMSHSCCMYTWLLCWHSDWSVAILFNCTQSS